MIPDDRSTRRSSERPIYGITELWIAFVEAIFLLLIGTASLMALATMALPTIALPTMALPMRVRPSVLLTEPIRPTQAIKQMRDWSIYIGAGKKWACLHRLPTRQTKMAMVLALSLVHETTLPLVHIKPTKAVITVFKWTSSLGDLLPLLQKYTKSTEFPKTTKKLRITWPLDSS